MHISKYLDEGLCICHLLSADGSSLAVCPEKRDANGTAKLVMQLLFSVYF